MTLRVALVCPYSLDVPGGVGTHVLGLARWLAGQGHFPTVIAPGIRVPEVGPGVRVELLGRSTGVPFNGSVANLAVRPGQSRRVVGLIGDADVVHVHEPLTPGIAFAAARAADPLVVTHHANFRLPGFLRPLLRARAGRLGTRSSLAVSQEAAATALSVTGTRPVVVPNAIDPPAAPARRTGWRGGLRPQIGFLGRSDEPRKGFTVFAEVAGLAAVAGLDADFVAAGPGSRARGTIRQLGVLTVGERARFLAGTDVLVAPNTSGESFGMVLVEALAAGCDVVASDLPAFTRVLDEAGVGTTFEAGSAAACLRVLRARLAEPVDPVLAHRAASGWSWQIIGPAVLRAYRAAGAMA